MTPESKIYHLTPADVAKRLGSTPDEVIRVADEIGLFYIEDGRIKGVPGLARYDGQALRKAS